MLKKGFAMVLALALLAGVMGAAALASERFTACTPLFGSGSAKRHNIELAVQAIDGTVIPYGGHFSFNEVVGPRTQNRGYETAPNGRGAMVTGGGVAQVASTLYLALLDGGDTTRIDPVKTYGSRFVDNYVDDPDYAVITDYDSGIDLSFTSRAESLLIEMWTDENYIYCALTSGEGQADGYDEYDDFDYEYDDGWTSNDMSFGPIGTLAPSRRMIASVCIDCTDDDDVLHNVSLAADSINDTTLLSGDIFSFNDVVGPRSKEYGYLRAINGRGKRVTGGGVAQVASVLWLAIKDDPSFAILEKSTYGSKYNQHYVDSSADAILTDYSSGRDFSFRYTGPGSVTFYTYLIDGTLYCDIYAD